VRRGRKGFTIVELLIAVGILAIGMVALLGLVSVGLRSQRMAQQATDMTAIATSKITDLRHELDKQNASAKSVCTGSYQQHDDFPAYWYKVDAVELDKYGREVYVRVSVHAGRPPPHRGDADSEVFETIVLRRR
jgi:uncharacterized protein (TIGR02598 family)